MIDHQQEHVLILSTDLPCNISLGSNICFSYLLKAILIRLACTVSSIIFLNPSWTPIFSLAEVWIYPTLYASANVSISSVGTDIYISLLQPTKYIGPSMP